MWKSLTCFVWLLCGAAALGVSFFSTPDDVPLPDGFIELADSANTFDAPSGRLSTSSAYGQQSFQDTLKFYDQSLPALGWHKVGSGQYKREGQALTLSVSQKDQQTVLHLESKPKDA